MRDDFSQALHVLFDDLGITERQKMMDNQVSNHTYFIGSLHEVRFTTLSHRVYYQGGGETSQSEVVYKLHNAGSGANALLKKDSPTVDFTQVEKGQSVVILDRVNQFDLHYWNGKTAQWLDSWNSDRDERDLFPLAVHVEISATDARENTQLDADTEMKIANPNNEGSIARF